MIIVLCGSGWMSAHSIGRRRRQSTESVYHFKLHTPSIEVVYKHKVAERVSYTGQDQIMLRTLKPSKPKILKLKTEAEVEL